MNNKLKTALKETAPYAVIGTLAAIAIANPISWVALGYGLLKIGKNAYRKTELDANVTSPKQENLFF
jgi:hypothetical protein